MNFTELEWNQDCLGYDGVTMMGFQASYSPENGYVVIIDCKLNESTEEQPDPEPLASATAAGQLYTVSVFPWDRLEGKSPLSVEENCDSARVQVIMNETAAITV